jgi:Domain of unknown function (DUF4440)
MKILANMLFAAALLPAVMAFKIFHTSGRASAQANQSGAVSPELRKELLATRDAVWRAWFANDQATSRKLLAAEFIGIGNLEAEWGSRDHSLATAEAFAKQGGRMVALRFPRTEMQVYGDAAILYFEVELEVEQAGKTQKLAGTAAESFVHRDGLWLNSGSHVCWDVEANK